VRAHHLRYTQSFLYFLAHDADVPKRVRDGPEHLIGSDVVAVMLAQRELGGPSNRL
jgi:hypothetical protein